MLVTSQSYVQVLSVRNKNKTIVQKHLKVTNTSITQKRLKASVRNKNKTIEQKRLKMTNKSIIQKLLKVVNKFIT